MLSEAISTAISEIANPWKIDQTIHVAASHLSNSLSGASGESVLEELA